MNVKFYLVAIFIFLSSTLSAQNLSGQWTGGFVSTGDAWGRQTEYVLELEVSGTVAKGHSYTYFIIGGKRHYVICRLSGTYDKGSKSVTVSEVEKVKSNTPPDFKDCFQTHSLTFLKQGEKEVLEGRWKPATIKDNCGTGETVLERKALVRVTPNKTSTPISQEKSTAAPQLGVAKTTPQKAKTAPPTTKTAPQKSPAPLKKTSTSVPPKTNQITRQPASGTQKPKTQPPSNGTREVVSNNKTVQKPAVVDKPQTKIDNPQSPSVISSKNANKLETRTKQLIKLIEVPESSFKIDLYDNGQVDGDTISVFFNGKLIVSSKRLSTTPITLNVKLDPDKVENELVMYAENLGSIPPNTALMVVTVGDKRYEVNITSTDKTNGTVRFKLKE
jgi:hypothetical protein